MLKIAYVNIEGNGLSFDIPHARTDFTLYLDSWLSIELLIQRS